MGIPKIAEERGLFPWMTFKAIMTRFLIERTGNRASVTKKQIQQVIKNPHLIKDVQLQLEAIHCSTQDQLQGLITDSLRHIVGKDYEQILEKELKQVKLLFARDRLKLTFRKISHTSTKKPSVEWDKMSLQIFASQFQSPLTTSQFVGLTPRPFSATQKVINPIWTRSFFHIGTDSALDWLFTGLALKKISKDSLPKYKL